MLRVFEVLLRQLKPKWLKARIPSGEVCAAVSSTLARLGLHTICEKALCPNIGECWGSGTATFLILGDVCTRTCRFCNVKIGEPKGLVDPSEPRRVAEAVSALRLKYAVVTSVCRDDLPDGGAEQFRETVQEIRKLLPDAAVEVLIPDFRGSEAALRRVVEARPDVVGHNIETVRRLTPIVRDKRAGYELSLRVLKTVKELDPSIVTKSSILLGLGEEKEEVVEAMGDLRSASVDVLTIGQYLQPTARHIPVSRYVSPEEFDELRRVGEEMEFAAVISGPLVRSSYRSADYLSKLLRGRLTPQ